MSEKLFSFILTAAIFTGAVFSQGVQTFGQTSVPSGAASIHNPASRNAFCPAMNCTQQILQTPGRIPIQAAIPLKINQLGANYNGSGVTIGVISDSYNNCSSCSTNAAQDVANGNLPGAGNPDGNTNPVTVLQEGQSFGSDDGRAILQIIYGLVPKAKLCFTTVGDTQSSFASAINTLADPSKGCGANVIYDDINFFDEPIFSDGVITQAINQVTAAGVTYVTGTGNNGSGLLDATFNKVDDSVARAGLPNTNLKLNQVPSSLTLGGFHNFSIDQQTTLITRTVTFSNFANDDIIFQWDDPFNPNKISADYNLLVFDAAGNYLASNSSTDNNFLTGEPFELAAIFSGSAARTYQLAISKTAVTHEGVTPAARLRWVLASFGGTFNGPNAPTATPSLSGHSGAAAAISAASYYYANSSTPESFNSYGPFINYFDSQGNRLAQPEVRLKPDVSGVDGLDTSFLGADSDSDGFPNLLGSSASGATIAAVAALTIQAAGGPGRLSPAKVKTILKATAARSNWQANDGYGLVNGLRAINAAPLIKTPFDFDGDGNTDVSVFRPSDGNWYSMRSGTGFSAVNWGIAGDKPVPADYDGDGKTDLCVFRENGLGDPNKAYFFILKSSDNTVQFVQFGRIGDDPAVVGDWDGDGKADVAVYRDGANAGDASYFYYHPSLQPSVAFVSVPWGISGDKPVVGDYDSDGKLDAAVFRPSNAVWYIQRSSDKTLQASAWGISTDQPMARDFDGDGKTDLTVFRGGDWYILQSTNSQFRAISWGISTDVPVPADYDGDGKADAAVYRNGIWYLLRSSDSQAVIVNFGLGTDTPLPSIQ